MNKEDNKKLEIKQKKEYICFLTNQLFKLKSNQRHLEKKLEQTAKEIKNYEQEKIQTEKWLTKNS